MATSFLKRVQSSPKVRAVRAKIRIAERTKKKLSTEYRRAMKSESIRLGKKIKKNRKAKRKATRRRR